LMLPLSLRADLFVFDFVMPARYACWHAAATMLARYAAVYAIAAFHSEATLFFRR